VVRALFAVQGSKIAAVIVEAASAANMGSFHRTADSTVSWPPSPSGALVIFDEVLTGFRVGPAGWWARGRQDRARRRRLDARTSSPSARSSVAGCPSPRSAAVRDVMDYLAPLGPVYQAGTLSNNPVAVAAGIATLRLADASVYARLDAVADFSAAVSSALSGEGVEHPCSVPATCSRSRSHPMVPAQLRRCALAASLPIRAPFFHAMLDAGVLAPSVFEAWFVSAAHDDAAVSRISRLPAAARAAAEVVPAINCPRSPACVPRSTVCSACGLPPAV
jgi:glutamate-1-semialdehyde 2,1-aminomutase